MTWADGQINFIDLFAGAGGLSEGFLAQGYLPVAHVEMNTEACRTLETRACYYYLKGQNRIDIYQNYLRGKISREDLFASLPKSVLDTVINVTMSESAMQPLFNKIDGILKQQSIREVDLIVGGPPCQAYSIIGRSRSSDGMKTDPRNHLYKLYCRVLTKYKPKMFVFENVPGLLTAGDGQYYEAMKVEFEKAGYIIKDKILNARDFGVLQNRQRVILIGWKKRSDHYYPSFQTEKHEYFVKDILRDLNSLQPDETSDKYHAGSYSKYLKWAGIRNSNDILTWHTTRPTNETDREIYRLVIEEWNVGRRRLQYGNLPERLKTHRNTTAFSDRFKVVASNLPYSHTMVAHIAKDGHYFIHPDYDQARSLSVREAARIQSFPDNFFFEGSRTAALTQIGNAVPPVMASGIAAALKLQLEEAR